MREPELAETRGPRLQDGPPAVLKLRPLFRWRRMVRWVMHDMQASGMAPCLQNEGLHRLTAKRLAFNAGGRNTVRIPPVFPPTLHVGVSYLFLCSDMPILASSISGLRPQHRRYVSGHQNVAAQATRGADQQGSKGLGNPTAFFQRLRRSLTQFLFFWLL